MTYDIGKSLILSGIKAVNLPEITFTIILLAVKI